MFDWKDDWLTTHGNTLHKTALLAKWIRNSVQNQTPVFIHLSGQDSRTVGIKWKNSDQVSTMLRRQCQITTLGANTNEDYLSWGLFNNIKFAIIIFSHFDIHKRQSVTYIQGLLYVALFYLTVAWGKIECYGSKSCRETQKGRKIMTSTFHFLLFPVLTMPPRNGACK